MKIQINYDLISKITEANIGFSINKSVKKVLIYTAISSTIITTLNIENITSLEDTLNNIALFFSWHSISTGITSLFLYKECKSSANKNLKNLSLNLTKLNLNTDENLLLKSYKYNTEYEINYNDSLIPTIEQRKYIMIPTYKNGEEEEISIVQEHIIGTNQYDISYGEPKKVLKLSKNPI